MDYLLLILQFVIFPGFLFTAAIGLVISWIDRKVTAKVQMRVGPPFLQPFYDVLKYIIKETIVPAGASKWFFLSAPLLGFGAVICASMIIWRTLISPENAFVGDWIVVLYLLTLPSLSVILGSFASRNPLASLGGSREMKLILSYELPFILACLVPVIKTQSIQLGEITAAAPAAASISGVLALIVAILCAQAKLALVPFDMAEAETEITGGALVEYSGPPLGIYKLTHAMMLFTVPMFVVLILCGGIDFGAGWVSAVLGILKYVGLIVAAVLIRNTAPRIRIDQALKFFWGIVTVAAILAVALAGFGW